MLQYALAPKYERKSFAEVILLYYGALHLCTSMHIYIMSNIKLSQKTILTEWAGIKCS